MRSKSVLINNTTAAAFSFTSNTNNDFIDGDFIAFNDSFKLEKKYLKDAVVSVKAPVTASSIANTVLFAGTYAAGETIKITVTSNLTNAQKFRKTYTIEVIAGDTVTTIAAKLAAKIQFDVDNTLNTPFASATSSTGTTTITQVGDDSRGLVIAFWTDSASGTINVNGTVAATQGEEAPTIVVSEGQVADLTEAGIDAADISLSTYDTVRIKASLPSAEPFIDSNGSVVKELVVYVDSATEATATVSLGNVLANTIAAL